MPDLHFGSYDANADDFMFSPHVKDDLVPLWDEGQLQNVQDKRLRIDQELFFNILFECYYFRSNTIIVTKKDLPFTNSLLVSLTCCSWYCIKFNARATLSPFLSPLFSGQFTAKVQIPFI